MPVRLVVYCVVLMSLTSCSWFRKKPPEPVFRSMVRELPSPGTRVVVWAVEQKSVYVGAQDTQAEQEASTWLQEHGVGLVRRAQVERVLAEQQLPIPEESGNPTVLLTAGRLAGAQQVIVLQAYSDRVMIRGVNTENGAIMWSGTGQYKESVSEMEARKPSPSLTRKTLEAIWKSPRRSN